MDEENSPTEAIRNLELINWIEDCSADFRVVAIRDGKKVKQRYETFNQLIEALIKLGPLVHRSPIVDLMFFPLGGEFDGDVLAIRASGRNIRRILIREDMFEHAYGDFQGCIDHLLSNNMVESEIEVSHLYGVAEKLDLSHGDFDPERKFDRLEVDIIAALQLINIKDKIIEESGESKFLFDLGYSVGRLFSSAQNYATLEDDAQKAREYKRSYKARGKKGKSGQRKKERLNDLFQRIQKMVLGNPALSRFDPLDVAKQAAQDAAEENPILWSQGLGQLASYLTVFASEEPYKREYRKLFPKTG